MSTTPRKTRMGNYHYLDAAGKPQGPVSETEVEKLAAEARQKGKELLVAKPGDTGWTPYVLTAAPVAAAAPPKRASNPTPARPPAAAAAGAVAAPTAAAAPAQAHVQAQAAPVARATREVGTPWVAVICNAVAGLFLLSLVATAVLVIAAIATKNEGLAAFAGTVGIAALPCSLASALFFAWAGKVVSLLAEIAANTRR
jgi:hypothetical protein